MPTPWGYSWGIQSRGLSVVNWGDSPKSPMYFSLGFSNWVVEKERRN